VKHRRRGDATAGERDTAACTHRMGSLHLPHRATAPRYPLLHTLHTVPSFRVRFCHLPPRRSLPRFFAATLPGLLPACFATVCLLADLCSGRGSSVYYLLEAEKKSSLVPTACLDSSAMPPFGQKRRRKEEREVKFLLDHWILLGSHTYHLCLCLLLWISPFYSSLHCVPFPFTLLIAPAWFPALSIYCTCLPAVWYVPMRVAVACWT